MNNDTTTPGQSSGGTVQSLKDEAVAIKDKAASRLASEADSRKGDVAGGMKQVSSALDAATSELEGGQAPDWLKQGFAKVATTVNSLASELEGTSSDELATKVQRFARQRPGTFLTACGAAGFAAARVFMAGQSSGSGSSNFSQQTFGGAGGGSTGLGGTASTTARPYGQDGSYGATTTGVGTTSSGMGTTSSGMGATSTGSTGTTL